jgi:hypothetical protein
LPRNPEKQAFGGRVRVRILLRERENILVGLTVAAILTVSAL